jgi:hypothetical protein
VSTEYQGAVLCSQLRAGVPSVQGNAQCGRTHDDLPVDERTSSHLLQLMPPLLLLKWMSPQYMICMVIVMLLR